MKKLCIDCRKKLNKWAKKDTLRCGSCAQKKNKIELFLREPDRKLLMSKIAKEAMLNPIRLKQAILDLNKRPRWNKGLKGVQNPYWLGKSNKDIIAKHHIDGNKKNNDKSNFLKIKQGLHRSLHWMGYGYLVETGLINDYLKYFILKYEIVNIKMGDGKVMHHIDCNRENSNSNNLMYLKDRKIHNKIHQESYKYLVRTDKVNDYINWFLLKEEEKLPKIESYRRA